MVCLIFQKRNFHLNLIKLDNFQFSVFQFFNLFQFSAFHFSKQSVERNFSLQVRMGTLNARSAIVMDPFLVAQGVISQVVTAQGLEGV